MPESQALSDLGQTIQSRANSIREFLCANNLPQPSFSQGASPQTSTYPSRIQKVRTELLEALDELRALTLGPTSYVYYTTILSPAWTAVFNVLYSKRIAHHVPECGAISYAELSSLCGLSEDDTRRVVRASISLRLFQENPIGFVKHNAASAVLSTPTAHNSLGFFVEEFTPAALKLPESLTRFPNSKTAGESAIAIANGGTGDRDIFSIISPAIERVNRFSSAMSFGTTVMETSSSHFIESVPWSDHGGDPRIPKVVVDVGGSRGDLCEALLRKYPTIEKAIVQDLPGVTEENVVRGVPQDLNGRVEYQAYNFFTNQTVLNADIFIFRTVLHDWPDSYAIQILQNQRPALKAGTKLLINDICILPPSGTNTHIEKAQCAHDLFVKMGLNAMERTEQDWVALLKKADQRFKLESIVTPPQSVLSIIEIVWHEVV